MCERVKSIFAVNKTKDETNMFFEISAAARSVACSSSRIDNYTHVVFRQSSKNLPYIQQCHYSLLLEVDRTMSPIIENKESKTAP